jgi:hypothetical protein
LYSVLNLEARQRYLNSRMLNVGSDADKAEDETDDSDEDSAKKSFFKKGSKNDDCSSRIVWMTQRIVVKY